MNEPTQSAPAPHPAPRPRMCIQCGQPIIHGVYVPVPAVARGPHDKIIYFVSYHMSCQPPALIAAGYSAITAHKAAA